MESAIELRSRKGTSARKRSYYSELVSANHAPDGACADQPLTRAPKIKIAPREVMSSWRAFRVNKPSSSGPMLRDNSPGNTSCGASADVAANEPWVILGQEPSIVFARESFAPKVQMPVEAEPRHLVRNVETERRRRLYRSFELEVLFREAGIESPSVVSAHHYLPLELFDDKEYDCRTPSEWLDLGLVRGKRYPIPAEALVPEEVTGEARWQPVAVTQHDAITDLYQLLTLDGTRRVFHLPRVFVRFYAEDPRVFVKRVVAALQRRIEAENGLRHSLELDCMPYDGIEALSDEQKSKIQLSAVRQDSPFKPDSISAVMREIERNYQRVMCDLECSSSIRCRRPDSWSQIGTFGRTNVDPQSPGPPSPKKREPSRMKNFSGVRDYVKWKILYVHVEVYEAMASIVNACDQAANVTLFPTERGKPVPIEEFNELQFCGTNAAISWLRKRWLEIMERSTRMHLRDIGKGHFDLDLGQHDVYEGTKLCRFFELTRLRMQISLRTLIESSSLAYLVYLETPTLGVLDQKLDGSFSWPKDLKSERFFHEAPIFLLEIELNESSAFYTTDPRVFQEMLVSLYTQALMDCQKIGQVHPRLLENLKFPRNLWIESVDLEEPLPTEVRKRVREAYQASVIPLQAYVKMYDRYCPLFTLDPAKYAEDFVSSEHPPSELREEILSQQSLKRSLEADLPESLVIGAFEVSVSKLKKLLTDKRQQMVDCLLGSHASRLRTLTEDILVGLRAVYTKLAVEPDDIEQLQETREWMESLNVVVAEYMDSMQRLKPEYDLLDAFCWSLSDEDTQSKFEAARLPSLIQFRELETQETLAFLQKDTFYKLQLEDESATAEKIDGLIGSVSNVMMQKDVGKVQEIAAEVKKLWASMKETEDFGFVLNSRQKLFGVPVRPFRNLTKLLKNFEPYKSFWTTSAEWFKWYDVWMYEPLMGIENGQIEAIVNEWHKTISRCVKLFQDIQDLSALANDVKEQIDNFKPYVGVIQALRNPGMKTRHLEQISNKVGMNATEMSELTFADLLSLDIMRFEEDIKDISEGAAKEYAIEETLNKMIADWATLKVEVAPYKETGMYIVRVSDELQILLDDHILNTQQLSFSQFKGALEGEIDDWYSKLCLTREVIVEWLEVQKLWMYLEPIFSSEDISRQLPTEAKKYNSMERNWRRITKQALDNPTIMQLCPDRTLLESLRECMSLLETVQKGLSDFLESRRLIFPRFFFLSDDELLSMLAEAKSPRAVQPHLKKCFENIKEVRFAEMEAARITHMCSAEGEEVALEPSPLEPRAAVEYWLGELEDAMRETLRCCAERALHSVEKQPRRRWIFRWPGQVALCIGQASWTSHVERAIATSSLPNYFGVSISQLDELRELVRQPRTDVERLMLEAIITIEVHARDVLQRLIDDAVRDVNDFNWISQLRYYWVISPEQSIGDLKIRAVNAEFPYGYEYLGNNGRLVITPLTDRCYLTLTGALHLKFGGAPAGPAGTGKTETTKDLAKALAIQCVVFNCSDQLDYMSMGKFFKGLASSGAWACFDEFNRIDVEVLSVIAQQVMTIQKAQQLNAERFIFEGVELRLRMSCAVFITMNPGYAGRTELPDNLKALFRPVAMMVPLVHLIAEISLFSCGFGQAKALATKITATFKLSSEQLSSQDHYDFGMRSVKTVIAVAGNLKREQKDMSEQQICLKALRDVNVPKFLRDDLILFNGIISDLFPQVEEKQMDYATLVEGIRKSIRKRGLAEVPTFIQKVIQLYETTIVRHGLMLVGATGSGKTKCYQVLQGAFELLKGREQPSGKPFTPAIAHTVNPKSITMGQLYGEFDLNTHEWTDGIFSSLLRDGAAAEDDLKRWYVFDGPVDAVWIENMNTVLDDNKKLCLTSGEIIRLTPTQTMMFEVEDLKVASPATVSRCGMVYFEPQDLGVEPLIDCWIARLPEHVSELSSKISKLAREFLLPGLRFLRDELKEIVGSVDSGLSHSFINLMSCQIELAKSREDRSIFDRLVEPWSVFALVWSVGATCDGEGRYSFNKWLRKLQKTANHQMQFPAEGLVYDYRLVVSDEDDESGRAEWVLWLDASATVTISPEAKFSDIEIPTIDMVRTSVLIDYLLSVDCNVLSVGPTGSGKTLTISTKLSRDMPKKYICDFIIFSARTSANQTQDLIDSKLDKRRRGVYGPPILKKQIFFIDDLNMPALETYGAQPPIELLRQYMDFKGWYDRKEIGSFRRIEDVNFVCAMAPPGGGRNPVSARLLRHFHFIAIPEMEDETKSTIFGTILSSWLARGASLGEFVKPIMITSLRIFSTLCKELLPTPDKCHYTFNVRDLGKVFQGMLMAEPSQIHVLDDLLLLWYHENCRVFRDRLVNEADRQWFDRLVRKTMMEVLDYDVRQSLLDDALFYGNFCNPDNQYERIRNAKNMENTMLELLEDYNSSTTVPINLVLFEDAMSHVCRITRILNQSPGNALLLGMGGSGRQSLTKLSSHIAEYSCFQIELTKAYSMRDWRDDVKSLLLKTGVHDRSSVFLFSDVQIKYDAFLEDINNILSSGDVPNIYQSDEINQIFQATRNIVQESGLPVNRSNLLAAYRKIVRNNLHAVITMCPIGELFRSRIRQFPALVNMCTIDWFDPWPDSALRSVAFHFLSNTGDEAITGDVLKSIVDTCQFMHSSVIRASEDFLQELNRHNYVTPTSYLELLSSYGDLLDKKKRELHAGINRLSVGLEKLASTEIEVKEMQITLEKMQPELVKAAKMSAKMIEEIGRDTTIAEEARAQAAEQEKEALKLKKANQIIRDDAEADLNTVRPMLLEAENSLKALNKGDITEVKAMKRPPPGVVLVIEAMCIVKGVKPLKIAGERPGEKLNDYWTPGSLMLADAGQFLTSLANYDKEAITEDIILKLKPYVANPGFHPKKIMKVSKACHSLCMWLHAMYNYYFVNERVKPKMAALEQAQSVLVSTEAALAEAMAKLEAVQAGLDKLQQKFQREEERKRELEAQKQLCQDRMSRAVRLVSGLADESKRWLASVAKDKVTLGKLVGDVLLCAGAIAYLTPFVDSYRKRLLSSWQQMLLAGVPHTPGREPVTLLGDPVEIRMWHLDGLPRDALSVENAVLVANSRRWPLLVDPQGQAHRWLRNLGGRSAGGLSTVRMSDRDLLRVVESCVRFGRTCLIENVGLELEPALDTVLMRSLFRQAGQLSVKIGDNVVPYNEDFRLYLVTKLPNPHYAPEVAVKVLIVNFSLTASGLSDQMLSLVIMHERPDLEETRSSLLVASAQMKQELQQIEDRILLRLSLSEGSAVDDIDLIDTLEASKIKSEEIKLKVVSAETAQESIDAARSLYVPVADRAQVLFFCLLDLQLIDTMYQYSLEWFIRIFTNSMLNTEKDDDVGKRVQGVNDFFTFALYCNVCQSLFERHKLHFAFLLCVRIQMMGDLIDRNEWKFLLSGAISPRKEPNPAPEWLPERCWAEILSLQVLPKFQSFVPSFKNLVGKFQLVFEAQQPEKTNLPEPWNGKLDDLEKLIVLKCLRPDKVVNAVQIYVSVHLGAPFVEPQASGLDAMFKETSPTTPFIFVLSSGTDPASELYKFAEKHKMARKLYSISLGQGQGPRAELMLKQSIDVGNWIFFQNCHLAPSWMPTLEILVEKLPPNDIHRDFRLWLTSMPSTAFPVSILQNGCKLTMEPPRGVKANMMRTYSTKVVEMQEFFESEHPKVANFKSLVYSLSLFHAVLLERRKYGPLGFNIPYEFTDGDFVICMSQLHMFLLEYTTVPFKVLTYTAGHINYGGRITDDWDRRCVLTILSMFYNERVLVPGHQFDPEGLYFQPPGETSLAEYVALIKQFPINDDPGLFGLHANANISYAQAETYACLTSLETLQPRDIAVAGATEGADEGLTRLARRILDGLPELFHLPDIQRKYPVMYEESLNMVLAQEATRYNALLKIMSSSLKDLLLAIKGVVVMSETLETMALALNSNKVPENWQRRAFASLKPLGAWVEDLKRRTEFIRQWQEAGIPAAFWISGFYFPQALLTGTLQNYARKYGLAIDTIDFAFQVLPAKPDRAPENGCVVYGLFLEGCRWDGSYLAESLPRELFTDMAPVLFLPEIDHKVAASGIYECPVYKTVKRAGTLSTTGHSTNFILPMEIPSREPQAHWITRGVALICSLDF